MPDDGNGIRNDCTLASTNKCICSRLYDGITIIARVIFGIPFFNFN